MILTKSSYSILTPIDAPAMLARIEAAGRTCYRSEAKITADSADKFVRSLIQRGHESVIEHESISVRFICSRAVSHQLVRHRIASYSQESQRYVNYSKRGCCEFIVPHWIGITPGEYIGNNPVMVSGADINWFDAIKTAQYTYLQLINVYKITPEQARDVLPNATKTEIVATMNLRAWRHVLRERTQRVADPAMRELMVPLLAELTAKLPAVFGDINKS